MKKGWDWVEIWWSELTVEYWELRLEIKGSCRGYETESGERCGPSCWRGGMSKNVEFRDIEVENHWWNEMRLLAS